MYKCMSVLYECQVCHVNLKVHGRIWVLCTYQLIQFSVGNLPLSYYFLMSTVHYLLSGKKQDSQIPILGLWMMPHLIWQLVCLNPVKWILFYKYKVLTSVTLIVFTACSSLWIHVNQDGCHQRLFLKITWLFPDKNYIFLLPKNTSNRQLQHPISQSL